MPREEASVYLVLDLEARRIKFLVENLLDAGAVESGGKWAFHPGLLMCSKSQHKTHHIAQIRHFEPQKCCNERIV